VNTEGKTIGEMLRAAREAKKLSVEQVTQETKISTQTVRALEQDDFGAFSSETYLKGFLRTYASFLGLDFVRLWSMMGQRTQAQSSGPGPSWEIEAAPREEKLGPPRWVRRLLMPVLLVVIIVLVILLARERGRSRAPQTGLGGPAASGAPFATG
jgi:cytoskeletal protein RodZ